MGDPTYPLFPTFAFLGFVVALVPMAWHLQAWNAGTCIYMIWASFASLIEFVDAVVWNGSTHNIAPVWCDISTKFLIGAGVGIPASSLCINRRLYKISSIQAATITREDKRRAVFEDIAIGVGVPTLIMILHYVVQGHRFNILENVGCTPDIWNTPPAYPLVFMWPVLLGCISFVYAALTLRAFWRRRAQFNQLLASNNAMTVSRYFRLMLLCCIEMACTVPLGAFSMYINNTGLHIAPYVSWSNAHYDFSFVEIFPAAIWTSRHPFYISVQMGRWIYPCSAFLFFALFGFANEARRHYRLAFWWIAKRFGCRSSQKRSSNGPTIFGRTVKLPGQSSRDTLPAYVPPAYVAQKSTDSMSSLFPMNADLEKGSFPPSSASPFGKDMKDAASYVDIRSSPKDADIQGDSDHCIIISDEHPASTPPSPCLISYPEPAAVPSFHRPFSPPTIYPVSPTRAAASDSSIQVTIHTEAVQSV
ncbi:hypothetical protein AcV5_010544 [Taiwanofungus camphoratus]|nr:hypothetical protein AcV5_010544 [Antrodia cinnamomea]